MSEFVGSIGGVVGSVSCVTPLQRLIEGKPEISGALDVLDGLTGPDLTTVLLELFRRRRPDPASLAAGAAGSRFTRPSPIGFERIRRAEEAVLSVVPDWVSLVQLAPATPVGAHVALGGSSQDRLVSTIRRTEMAADPTLGLALEIAVRRRSDRTDRSLATVQRVTRAQVFDGDDSFAHFTTFGMVTAGRDRGRFGFERWSAVQHVRVLVEGVEACGGADVGVSVIDPEPDLPLFAAIAEAFPSLAVTHLDAPLGEYYQTARFGITAMIGGRRLHIGDGGFTDWTAKMLSDRKERTCISGLGIDRLAVTLRGTIPPDPPDGG